MDMCKLLLGSELVQVPTYVAKNLSNLPSLANDGIDISKLLHEIKEIKVVISLLSANQSSLAEFVHKNKTQTQETSNAKHQVEAKGISGDSHSVQNPELNIITPSVTDLSIGDDFITVDQTSCTDSSIAHTISIILHLTYHSQP